MLNHIWDWEASRFPELVLSFLLHECDLPSVVTGPFLGPHPIFVEGPYGAAVPGMGRSWQDKPPSMVVSLIGESEQKSNVRIQLYLIPGDHPKTNMISMIGTTKKGLLEASRLNPAVIGWLAYKIWLAWCHQWWIEQSKSITGRKCPMFLFQQGQL